MTNPDFIEIYAEALDASFCRGVIARFEASGQAVRGSTGGGVDTRLKDSWDITLADRPEWKDIENCFNAAMLRWLMAYVRKYAYCVLAPMALRTPDPQTGELVLLDPPMVAAMPDNLLQVLVTKCFRPGSINLQKYHADQGGYPYWHCELFPKADNGDTLHRVLLWSVYLNDGFEEGETEFHYQQRKIVPHAGSLLIAPAGFTHTHRGNMPRRGDKYLATSWVLFQRAEQLYATPAAPR